MSPPLLTIAQHQLGNLFEAVFGLVVLHHLDDRQDAVLHEHGCLPLASLRFQEAEADAPVLDVRVQDRRQEFDRGRREGVRGGDRNLECKHALVEGRVWGPEDLAEPRERVCGRVIGVGTQGLDQGLLLEQFEFLVQSL